MPYFFKVVRKKRNLRYLSAVWLVLVALELLCPIFCENPAFAASLRSSKNTISYSTGNQNKESEDSVAVNQFQNRSNEESICSDECLCHAAALISFSDIDLNDESFHSERMAFAANLSVSNSLPPPYIPPKQS